MADEFKRMRYFDGLFLKAEEFNLEQNYHLRMRRLHNRHFHTWGIVTGLEVVSDGGCKVIVEEGMALNKVMVNGEEVGQEIILQNDEKVDLSAYKPLEETPAGVYIYVSYSAIKADVETEKGGPEEIHWLEKAEIGHGAVMPENESEFILLAKVLVGKEGIIDAGDILYTEDNRSLRTNAGFAGESINTEKLILSKDKYSSGLPAIEAEEIGSENGINIKSSVTKVCGRLDVKGKTTVGDLNIDGNIGIGTKKPKAKFDLNGNSFKLGRCRKKDGSVSDKAIISSDGVNTDLFPGKDDVGTVRIRDVNDSGAMTFENIGFSRINSYSSVGGDNPEENNSSNLALQTNGGNVGIGTVHPEAKFDLYGCTFKIGRAKGKGKLTDNGIISSDGVNTDLFPAEDDKGLVRIRDVNSQGAITFENIKFSRINSYSDAANNASSDLILQTNKGNVGIGTSKPKEKLHVKGNIEYSGRLKKLDVEESFASTVRSADFMLGHSTRRGQPGRALVDFSNSTLEVNYGADWQNVRINGNLINSSSVELKENISDLSIKDAMKVFKRLNPVQFNFKADNKKELQLGFIAENVPDIASSNDHKGIKPTNIIALITKIVQEQQKQINLLEKEIKSLKTKNIE